MEVFYCFTVAIGLAADASDDIQDGSCSAVAAVGSCSGRQLQRACKTRWLSREATVRAMGVRFCLFRPH